MITVCIKLSRNFEILDSLREQIRSKNLGESPRTGNNLHQLSEDIRISRFSTPRSCALFLGGVNISGAKCYFFVCLGISRHAYAYPKSRPCTRALKWAPGPCVHVFSVGPEEFYPRSTSSLLLQKWRLLTEQNGRKTMWVPRVCRWTKHHFIPVPWNYCPGTRCESTL